jgi:hypothetical protein
MRLSFGVSSALVLFAGSSSADEGSGSAAAPLVATETKDTIVVTQPVKTVRRWYGWQLVIADVASTGLLIAGALTQAAEQIGGIDDTSGVVLVWTSVGAFAFGGPIIHAAHGRFEAMAGSFGLRFGGPLVGVGIGALMGAFRVGCQTSVTYGSGGFASITPETVTDCSTDYVLGGFIGAVVGAVIDDSVLAWERVPVRPAAASAPSSFGWTPTFAPVKGGGATAGIAGTF